MPKIGPIGWAIVAALAVYTIVLAVGIPPFIVIALFDCLTVAGGVALCWQSRWAVYAAVTTARPTRAHMWVTGGAIVLGATTIIRSLRIVGNIFNEVALLLQHPLFGYATDLQIVGVALLIIAGSGKEKDADIFGRETTRILLFAIGFGVFLAINLFVLRFIFGK